jgi:peptidoglycan hydrolase-like protein with peptidoglycan-binding domain
VPAFALLGKKVRWTKDGRLMVRWKDTEIALYDFSSDQLVIGKASIEYAIPGHGGFTRVAGYYGPRTRSQSYHFTLANGLQQVGTGSVQFLHTYGPRSFEVTYTTVSDIVEYFNSVSAPSATISGESITAEEVLRGTRPTILRPRTWGSIKSTVLARTKPELSE